MTVCDKEWVNNTMIFAALRAEKYALVPVISIFMDEGISPNLSNFLHVLPHTKSLKDLLNPFYNLFCNFI